MATKDKDIQEYKRASKHLTELGEKLHNKPWFQLAEAGLKSHAVINCMHQEAIPIGDARRRVRSAMDNLKELRNYKK